MRIFSEPIPYSSVLLILGVLYVIFRLARFGSREKHLPPGPPTYPIIGNAHLVVDKDLYKRSEHPVLVLAHQAHHPQVQRLE